jgi:hypothetical protein
MVNYKLPIVALALVLLGGGVAASQAGPVAESPVVDRGRAVDPRSGHEVTPELAAYLGYIQDEEDELEYQLENDEINTTDYRISRNRLSVTRDAVLRIAKGRADAAVPELHVLLATEITQVLADGLDAVRGKRPGDRLNDMWIYHGTVARGQVFHVFERTGALGPARAR